MYTTEGRPKAVIFVLDKGYCGPGNGERASMEKDDLGRYVIDLHESAAIIVEQIEGEITVTIASVVGVDFQVTAAQALKLSRALAAVAANAMAETVTPSNAW